MPTGLELNDKDYMKFLLATLKEMSRNYSIILTEVSNEWLYLKFKDLVNEVLLLQRETYELMFKNGWYSVEKADEAKINNKYNMLNYEIKELFSEKKD